MGDSGILLIIVVICTWCMAMAAFSWYEGWTCPLGFGKKCSTSAPSAPSSSLNDLATAMGPIPCPNGDQSDIAGYYNKGARALPFGTPCPSGTAQVITDGINTIGKSTSYNGYSICWPNNNTSASRSLFCGSTSLSANDRTSILNWIAKFR